MMTNPKRDAALHEIRQNIADFGFHTYVVTGSGSPHYGYTIGLRESLGAELVLAGAYFYRLSEVSEVIRSIAENLRAPFDSETLIIRTVAWGTFALHKVDPSWTEKLMMGAADYYQMEKVEAYQIIPDDEHWTIDIPDLREPWSANLAPAWRLGNNHWPYNVPKESVALTNLLALRGQLITEVVRWDEDEWEMFAGAGPDTREIDRRVVPLGILLTADPSLLAATNLAVGSGLWRADRSDWHDWTTTPSS